MITLSETRASARDVRKNRSSSSNVGERAAERNTPTTTLEKATAAKEEYLIVTGLFLFRHTGGRDTSLRDVNDKVIRELLWSGVSGVEADGSERKANKG
jgi:hypothetical protein